MGQFSTDVDKIISETIYLLPDRGGLLNKGLGQALVVRGFDVVGRELGGGFQRLAFREQVQTVARDLRSGFWHAGSRVIANSFGAYLFLHAQATLEPYPGKVLLLSPIVGEATRQENMTVFVPPMAGRLQQLVECGSYPIPPRCQIHVGGLDWQSNPENVLALAEPLGISAVIVSGVGHTLGASYVGELLDRWLEPEG